MSLSAFLPAAPVQAASERALYLYYTHTKETARIVFKRNGQYVQSGLNELNQFLRDWRQNEPARMDPRLFDLVWEVYQEVGGSQPVNVVSAYRSPKTNAMLAANSSGVADNSQHMRGTAMDFFIPGVPLARLRAAAMKKQVGGVGYYPTSGSPFVHLDTGSVRAWPRMTRAQLQDLFPDGRTMHLPSDGRPLSQEGYNVALAEWKRCHAYPCNGSSSGTQVAEGGSGRTLVDMLFGGGGDTSAPAAVPSAAPTVQTASAPVAPGRIDPVMPLMRPADLGGAPAAAAVADALEVAAVEPSAPAVPFGSTGSAPLTPEELGQVQLAAVTLPVDMPDDLRAAAATTLPSGDAVTALAALTSTTMPTPRLHMTNPPSETLTAYLPAAPSAQQAMESIIDDATTASVTPTPTALPPLRELDATPVFASTASLAPTPAAAPASTLFQQTFGATDAASAEPLAAALAQHINQSGDMRRPNLVAPDLEHVADVFTAPSAVTSDHFAVIFDHDQADFDPTPEMGRHVLVKGVGDAGPALSHTRFTTN